MLTLYQCLLNIVKVIKGLNKTPPDSAVQAESGPQHGAVILGIAPQKEVTLQEKLWTMS